MIDLLFLLLQLICLQSNQFNKLSYQAIAFQNSTSLQLIRATYNSQINKNYFQLQSIASFESIDRSFVFYIEQT
jgi:hypothetical protein